MYSSVHGACDIILVGLWRLGGGAGCGVPVRMTGRGEPRLESFFVGMVGALIVSSRSRLSQKSEEVASFASFADEKRPPAVA